MPEESIRHMILLVIASVHFGRVAIHESKSQYVPAPFREKDVHHHRPPLIVIEDLFGHAAIRKTRKFESCRDRQNCPRYADFFY
mgnify:CR=1 FL=1